MEVLDQAVSTSQVRPDPAPFVYMLSSRSGFGHASRAVAIAQELEPTQPITFVAYENVHSFIAANLDTARLDTRLEQPDYGTYMPDCEFTARNEHLVDIISSGRLIINDFLLQTSGIRSLMEQAKVSYPLVGVYHSIEGYESQDEGIREFQAWCRKAAQELDVLFLTEPRPEHADMYELQSGTRVIPCAPIVRRPFLDPATVKMELGLEVDDEFVYVQGGGLTAGEELKGVVASLQKLSVSGLKIVLAPLGGLTSGIASSKDIIHSKPRLDAQNIIAASAGVISKPGMGTICEAIASRKPLLLVNYPTPEGRAKFEMLQEILGNDLPFRLDIERPLTTQIADWLDAAGEVSLRFATIPCDGAATVARALPELN